MTALLSTFFGLYLLGIGIAFFLNPKRIGELYQQLIQNQVGLFLGGLIALLFGSIVISVHNVWVMGWPVVITIIGWMAFVKGIALMAFPNFANSFSCMFKCSIVCHRILGLCIMLLGLFFLYMGQ